MGGLSDLVCVVNKSATVITVQPMALEDGSVIQHMTDRSTLV